MIKKKLVFYCIIIHLLFTPCRALNLKDFAAYRVIYTAALTGAIASCYYPFCIGKNFLTAYCISSLPNNEKNVGKLLLKSFGEIAVSGMFTVGGIYLNELGNGKGLEEGIKNIPTQKLRALEIALGIVIGTVGVKGTYNYLAAHYG